MKIGYGFFCSTGDNRLSTNHRFMLKNLNKETLFKTVEKNINDFFELLKLSQKLGCSVFRLGSNFIPFFSHPQFKHEWKRELELMIKKISSKVKSFNLRITMHPGQFVVLNSENRTVIENSLRELAYHFWLLDQLGIDNNGVVVVHLGKVGEDKKLSMERFINTVNKNLWLKERLAIENDERFSTSETLTVAKRLGVPMVFDYFHHQILPSKIDLRDIVNTWGRRKPKFHLSSGEKIGSVGKHGDYIDKKDWDNFLALTKRIRKDFDVVFEVKGKEKAIMRLLL